jgi:hypothetical protein
MAAAQRVWVPSDEQCAAVLAFIHTGEPLETAVQLDIAPAVLTAASAHGCGGTSGAGPNAGPSLLHVGWVGEGEWSESVPTSYNYIAPRYCVHLCVVDQCQQKYSIFCLSVCLHLCLFVRPLTDFLGSILQMLQHGLENTYQSQIVV